LFKGWNVFKKHSRAWNVLGMFFKGIPGMFLKNIPGPKKHSWNVFWALECFFLPGMFFLAWNVHGPGMAKKKHSKNIPGQKKTFQGQKNILECSWNIFFGPGMFFLALACFFWPGMFLECFFLAWKVHGPGIAKKNIPRTFQALECSWNVFWNVLGMFLECFCFWLATFCLRVA